MEAAKKDGIIALKEHDLDIQAQKLASSLEHTNELKSAILDLKKQLEDQEQRQQESYDRIGDS